MDRTRLGLLLPLLLALGVLAACGDDGDDGDGGGTPAAGSRLWVVPDGAPPLDAAERPRFAAGTLYANSHTTANPNGEIRGQLDRGGTVRLATLNGAQETPAVSTTAFGAGALSVDEASGAVRGFVLASGLPTANAAHVHLAARGTPGDVIVPMTGGPELWVVPDDATPLTAPQIEAFLAGNLYFNVHTPANPNGAIRGQLDKPGTIRLATLNGAQETPAVTTSAYGAGLLSVDDADGAVVGFIVTSGLVSPNAAHVHEGSRGAPGDVRVPLVGGPSLWVVPDDATALSAGLRTAFADGDLYFNAHTPTSPNGEIRGQLDKVGAIRIAPMTGAQETPAVSTTALGAAVFALDDATGQVSGFFATTGLASPTVAHVHPGARGATGSPVVPLVP